MPKPHLVGRPAGAGRWSRREREPSPTPAQRSPGMRYSGFCACDTRRCKLSSSPRCARTTPRCEHSPSACFAGCPSRCAPPCACLLAFLRVYSLAFSVLGSADLFREILDAAASQQCLGVHVGHDATHLSQR